MKSKGWWTGKDGERKKRVRIAEQKDRCNGERVVLAG